MKIQAISKNVRISPRKVRLVADAIKPLAIKDALISLQSMRKRAASAIAKTLESAVANAVNNAKLDKNTLSILDIEINEGQAFKRFHASTRGRIHPYKKRSSHIKIVLEERKGEKKS
jgi:large subunit ribosomal protein L22